MELITTGPSQNTWVDLDDANLMIIEVPASSYGYEPEDEYDTFQFEPEDIAYLLESAKQISRNWTYDGAKTNPRQRLAWPRKGFQIDGTAGDAGWFSRNFPNLDESSEWYVRALHFDVPGLSRYEELASDEVPEDIREAQVILAAILKNGGTLFEDNKGDETSYSLGGISGNNINAVAKAQAVFERMSPWGVFIGGTINRAGGSRV